MVRKELSWWLLPILSYSVFSGASGNAPRQCPTMTAGIFVVGVNLVLTPIISDAAWLGSFQHGAALHVALIESDSFTIAHLRALPIV